MSASASGEPASAPPGPPPPPALARLGIERTLWEEGRTALRWRVPEERRLTNTAGHLHGGYLCVMADALLGSSLSSTLAPEEAAVNPDFHCHFLERVELGSVLEGEGRLVHRGRSVSFLEAELRDASTGSLVLVAHSTGVVRSAPAAASSAPTAVGGDQLSGAAAVSRDASPQGELPTWQLPPWLEDFGARFTIRDGRCTLTWPVAPGRFENRAGRVQGGYLCLVADATMGFALIHGVPDAWAMATTTLSLQLLRPVLAGDTVEVEAFVERRGRRFGFMGCALRVRERVVARGWASGLLRLRDRAGASA
jgi:uncharacterized protein (TIGR00369 family)